MTLTADYRPDPEAEQPDTPHNTAMSYRADCCPDGWCWCYRPGGLPHPAMRWTPDLPALRFWPEQQS